MKALIAVLLCVLVVSTVSARTISCDFESNSTWSTAAYPDTSGDYDPDALSGDVLNAFWGVVEGAPKSVQVTSYSSPGAHGGSKWLRLDRSAGGDASAILYSGAGNPMFGAPIIRIDTWTYAAGSTWQNAIGAYGNNGWTSAVVYGPSNNVKYYNGGWVSTSLNATQGVWQHLVVDMNLSTQKMSISLDGNTVSDLPFIVSASWLNQFEFYASNDTAYFDDIVLSDVPEPATITLLVFGLLTFLRSRRSS